jgi:hypothetical protein
MRVGLVGDAPACQHFDPLGRCVAALAGGADDIGAFRLGLLLNGVAHETPPPHNEPYR